MKYKRKDVIKMVINGIILLIILLFLLFFGGRWVYSKVSDFYIRKQNEIKAAEIDSALLTQSDAAEEESETEKETATLTKLPQVDKNASGEYEDNLDYNEFYFWQYSNDDNRFYFSYPSQLYTSVGINESHYKVNGSTNVIRYDLESNKDANRVCYQKLTRDSSYSKKEVLKIWYKSEVTDLYQQEDIINTSKKSTEEDRERFIIIGYTDSSKEIMIYELVTIEENNIYVMKIEMPSPVGTEDQNQKFYIIECMYRACGFSGTSKGCRTYRAYLDSL